MKNDNPHPHPIPIVVPNERKGQHKFSIKEKALRKILSQEKIRDRNVVVVSITGPYRKGKSFLLDFFLRYMYFKQTPGCDTKCWLGDQNTSLKGFSWRGGSKLVTTGIQMWSEVFCIGEDIAVIFLDTQGSFDDKSSYQESATVFALSTMLSSIQIYNLSKNIQDDDLQNLQMFADYGRLASENTGETPFQKLQFLVRDWDWPYDKSYGPDGGRALIQEKLMIQTAEERKDILLSFDDIQCFLLPDPGPIVRTNPEFDGKLSDINDEFKAYLRELVPLLLSNDNLIQKRINGQKIKVKDLLNCFIRYMNIFNGNTLPEPKSIFDANVDLSNIKAITTAMKTYKKQMEILCGQRTKHLKNHQFEEAHQTSLTYALQKFDETPKMGGVERSAKYKDDLKKKIDRKCDDRWKPANDRKKRTFGAKAFVAAGAAVGGFAGAAIAAQIGAGIGTTIISGAVGVAIGTVTGGVVLCFYVLKTALDQLKTF